MAEGVTPGVGPTGASPTGAGYYTVLSPSGERFAVPNSFNIDAYKGDGPPPGAIPMPPIKGSPYKAQAAAYQPTMTTTTQENPRSAVGNAVGALTQRLMGPIMTPGTQELIAGAVDDTLGKSNRPGADPLGRAVFAPQTFGEKMILPAIAAPITATAGGGLGALAEGLGLGQAATVAAPVAGRVAASAGVGALRNAARSEESQVGEEAKRGALTDGLTALFMEGLVPGIAYAKIPGLTKSASQVAQPMVDRFKEYWRASEVGPKAVQDLSSRIGYVKAINVPSLGGKMSPTEATQKLSQLTGNQWSAARQEIGEQFNALDRSGFGEKAGDLFWKWVPEARFVPKASGGEMVGAGVVGTTKNEGFRALADALGNVETSRDSSLHAGPAAAYLGLQHLPFIGKYIP